MFRVSCFTLHVTNVTSYTQSPWPKASGQCQLVNDLLSRIVQELLPKYTEHERQLTCPEGVCVQAVFQFQQPRMPRRMSSRARPRVTLQTVLVAGQTGAYLAQLSSPLTCRP